MSGFGLGLEDAVGLDGRSLEVGELAAEVVLLLDELLEFRRDLALVGFHGLGEVLVRLGQHLGPRLGGVELGREVGELALEVGPFGFQGGYLVAQTARLIEALAGLGLKAFDGLLVVFDLGAGAAHGQGQEAGDR
mgnify:CR=1 FL=1